MPAPRILDEGADELEAAASDDEVAGRARAARSCRAASGGDEKPIRPMLR
jgi:hypothetical protein